MRKLFYASSLVLVTSLLLTSAICYFFLNACRKLDHQSAHSSIDNTERFFKLPSDAHPALQKVVTQMRRMNQRTPFINDFVAKQGFAIWNKAVITPVTRKNTASRLLGETEEYSLLIPLVWDNGEMVHAAIAAKVTEDSVFFSLLDGSNYSTYNTDSASRGLNGRQLSATLMYLDNLVFGHNMYEVKDSAAFPCKGNNVKFVAAPDSIVTTSSEDRSVVMSYYICYVTWVPPHHGQVVGCPPGALNCNAYVPVYNCDFYNIIADDGYEYGDENPPPPVGGGEGGGGEGGNGYCRFFPGTQHDCGAGADPGWEPVDEETGGSGPYDPYIYDSVRISRYLKDSFPCLYSFLKDSFQNANQIAQLSGVNLFKDSARMHLRFEISDSATQENQVSAYTKGDFIYVSPENVTSFRLQ
jgi:hypothetical protein